MWVVLIVVAIWASLVGAVIYSHMQTKKDIYEVMVTLNRWKRYREQQQQR